MRTSKPIATISYNTEEFLKARLEELHKNHTIDDYIYIHHDAEEDEKKDHFHVWVSPNKLLDTMVLQDYFNELDPKHPDKPLKCMPFRASVQDDFILYGMHLQSYLLSKGQIRAYVYNKGDFRYCDEDTFEEAYRHALHGSEWAHRDAVLQLIREGQADPASLIIDGIVPYNKRPTLTRFYICRVKHFEMVDLVTKSGKMTPMLPIGINLGEKANTSEV